MLQHLGAAKTWYSVPASGADAFEEVVMAQIGQHKRLSQEKLRGEALKMLLQKKAVFSPKLLVDAGEKGALRCALVVFVF
jgi:hypothetical protein